jgi:uncharacterized membrane protein
MRRSPEANLTVAAVLRVGAYGAFTLLALGMLLEMAGMAQGAAYLMHGGIVVLLITPAARVLMVGAVFLHEGDRKYALAALGVLIIVLASWAVGMFRV